MPTVRELREECKQRGVKGYSKKNKAWLMAHCHNGAANGKKKRNGKKLLMHPDLAADVKAGKVTIVKRSKELKAAYNSKDYADKLAQLMNDAHEQLAANFSKFKPANEVTFFGGKQHKTYQLTTPAEVRKMSNALHSLENKIETRENNSKLIQEYIKKVREYEGALHSQYKYYMDAWISNILDMIPQIPTRI
jgi:hypothetical protein